MKKFLFAFVVSVLMCNAASFAQDSARVLKENAVMFELGGNGTLFSLSYERIYYQKDKLRLGARAGIGIWPSFDHREFVLEERIFPFVEATLLLGKRKGFFETGLGYTYDFGINYYNTYSSNEGVVRYPYHEQYLFYRLGYRYQGMKGFMFRAAATSIIYMEPDVSDGVWNRFHTLRIGPWIGLSFGYSF